MVFPQAVVHEGKTLKRVAQMAGLGTRRRLDRRGGRLPYGCIACGETAIETRAQVVELALGYTAVSAAVRALR